MTELDKPFWVAKRGADPTQKLDHFARYYATASHLDTIPTSCDTTNLTIEATSNNSTTTVGAMFDSDGLVTLYMTDSASAAIGSDAVGVHVTVYGRAKTDKAGADPEQISI